MAPPGSRTSLVNVRPMPMIHEDEDTSPPPSLPERSRRRSVLRDAYAPAPDDTTYTNFGYGPPPYGEGSDDSASAPDRKSLPQHGGGKIRDNEWFARRGGWYRLTLLCFLLAALIVGLGVGLTIGLKKSNESETSSAPPAPALFPAGSWSFTTALKNTSTACTSVSVTFNCYPQAVYSPETPDLSAATFNWIIASTLSGGLAISSSANPFAPVFSAVPLTLLDADQPTERLTFTFTLALPVVPAANVLDHQRTAATCTFRSTALAATLWTRRRADYPANVTAVPAPAAASDVFAPWPFRVDVAEVQAPGNGVPECVDTRGQSLGDFSRPAGGPPCGCWYTNYGLGNVTAAIPAGRRRG